MSKRSRKAFSEHRPALGRPRPRARARRGPNWGPDAEWWPGGVGAVRVYGLWCEGQLDRLHAGHGLTLDEMIDDRLGRDNSGAGAGPFDVEIRTEDGREVLASVHYPVGAPPELVIGGRQPMTATARLLHAIGEYRAAEEALRAAWDGETPIGEHAPPDVIGRHGEASAALSRLLPCPGDLGNVYAVRHEGVIYAHVGDGRVVDFPVDMIEDADPASVD